MMNIDEVLAKKKLTLIMKRTFDIIFALIGLIVLLPFFILIGFLIKMDSPGPVFYSQIRVGKDGNDFRIFKFRKMRIDVGEQGLKITTASDSRMTDFGKVLRKYKIDELPQLLNVFIGNMAFVGPRPETPNYVKLYSEKQCEVLKVKPGITDYASLEFIDEGEILETVADPNEYYINTLIPLKIQKNLEYIIDMSIKTDIKIILLTLWKMLRHSGGKNEGSNISRGQRHEA